MKILISGQHMNIGESLSSYIKDEVETTVHKYFERATSASVVLNMEKQHYIRAEIVVNDGTGRGLVIKGTAYDSDPYHSFDMALSKIEKQLRKHKSRIKEHQKVNIDKLAFFEAPKYVLASQPEEETGSAPIIIAEKVTKIETLTLGDAVMKMDLGDLPAYVFINSGSNRINVVYYRKDGNISWIDIPGKG